jgi:uncharacterized protein YjiS (DUF1127 family)
MSIMSKASSSVTTPFQLVLAGARTIIRGIDRLVRAFRHRKGVSMLAGFDERMLADIGLTRSDVRDAFAEPLWRDPTAILVDRASERRTNRVPLMFRSGQAAPPVAAPSIIPAQPCGSTAKAA